MIVYGDEKMDNARIKSSFQSIEKYGRILLLNFYQNIGIFLEKDEIYDFDDLNKRIGMNEKFKKLNHALLKILESAGYITIEGNMIKTTSKVNIEENLAEKCNLMYDRLCNEYKEIADYLRLLRKCVTNYKDIFLGKMKPTDLLFKQSEDLLSKVYGGNIFTDYFNKLVADSTRLYIENKLSEDSSYKVKILEIGAGTGGTTKKILPVIKEYENNIEYCFTDISTSFLIKAEDIFKADYSFVSYERLNIEYNVEEQFDFFDKQDIIVCSNVLHATKDIIFTLRNVRKLLKKTGWIILNEMIEPMEFTTMIFGMLEGWWLSEDTELRWTDSPLLSAEQWKECLESIGFIDTVILGNTEFSQCGVRQNVIISENSVDDKLVFHKTEDNNNVLNNTIKKDVLFTKKKNIHDFIRENLVKCMVESLRLKSESDYNDSMTFWDYGVDSILVNRVIQKINEELKIELSNQEIFNYGTMEKLVSYVEEKYGEHIKSCFFTDPSCKESINNKEEKADNDNNYRYLRNDDSNEIAVVGISFKLPKADNMDELWHNLVNGVDAVTEIPAERWNNNCYYNPSREAEGKYYCKYGAFISNVDCFEPMFFNISPKQAELMDPRQRLFMEQAYKAMEDVGYTVNNMTGKNVGVFVGCEGDTEYLKEKMADSSEYSSNLFLGNSNSVLASRLSYYMDWKGPAITVDTACSSSAVAIHLACQSLKTCECEVAVAGGVNLFLKPESYIMLSRMEMLSPDGCCKAFDNDANGFVPGEGIAAVVLKRLSDAKKNGDHIYCVIKASGINQDGKSNGIMAPNMLSQYELQKRLYEKNNIDTSSIQYIEAHGTGTYIGDPIEFEALRKSFANCDRKKSCGIGSLKSYIGHLGPASGIASLIKVILQMQHKKIIGNLHFKELNKSIDINATPFYICDHNIDWNVSDKEKRRAAINSFGHSGTNCHIVVEEYSNVHLQHQKNQEYLFCISAFSEISLRAYINELAVWLTNNVTVDIGDLAYTLNNCRTQFKNRVCVIASDREELMEKLSALLSRNNLAIIHEGDDRNYRGEAENLITYLKSNIDASDYKNKIKRLAELLEKDNNIDVTKLYSESCYNCINIPTYIFQKKRFWLKSSTSVKKEKTDIDTEKLQNSLMYKTVWAKKSNEIGNYSSIDDKIMILTSEDQINSFRKIYKNALFIINGNDFRFLADDIISIRISDYSDYKELCNVINNKFDTYLKIIHLWSFLDKKDIEEKLLCGVYSIFYLTKALMETKFCFGVRMIYVYESMLNDERYDCCAVAAFNESIFLENPKYDYSCLELSSELSQHDKINAINHAVDNCKADMFWRCDRNGIYFRKHELITDLRNTNLEVPFKQGGVYLITGGAGGIGKSIAKKLEGCKVILTGRRNADESINNILLELKGEGIYADYIASDISKYEEVDRLIKNIHEKYGEITGVLHSAGVFRNGFVLNKTKNDLKTVFAPKINGTLLLDELLKTEKLDFFVMFSSISSLTGKIGQSDYTYANSFMNYFASYRNNLVDSGERYGKTQSISWPYWAEGGMQISDDELKEVIETSGLLPMSDECGYMGLCYSLSTDICPITMIYSNERNKIDNVLNHRFDCIDDNDKQIEINDDIIKEYVKKIVCDIMLEELCGETDGIDLNTGFDCYGIDSIVVNHFNFKIAKEIHNLSKTLLYECNTINEVIDYIISNHRQQILDKIKTNNYSFEKSNKADEVINNEEVSIGCSEKDTEQNKHMNCILNEPIAIIGIDGRYPDADNVDEFWNNISKGVESISEIPLERWDYIDSFDTDAANAEEGKIYCKTGGFLKDVEGFDARFFNISPSEAELMDPQERIFLESAYKAMEDAGYTRRSISKNARENYSGVGVFVGVTSNSYQLFANSEWEKGNHVIPNAMPWSVANRISYLFNLNGPSIPVDTACSSSLMAVHLACQSLKRNECSIAIAGGVNVQSHIEAKYKYLCQLGMLSKSGKCSSFSNDADGFVPGEGVGTIILKTLSNALKDNDHIYGVIRGSAVNHGGKTSGYTVPNPNAQAEVIKAALNDAGVNARTIGCIEAHGTGTSLGDPIEIKGISKAYSEFTNEKQFCPIASVKANIGHLESASGIASITKMLMQFKHKMIAPSINSEVLNEKIQFEDSPVFVQHSLTEWKNYSEENGVYNVIYPRRGGISSFGAGGVNVHVILEEYNDSKQCNYIQNDKYIAVFSGKSQTALEKNLISFNNYLSDNNCDYEFEWNEFVDNMFSSEYRKLIEDEEMCSKITDQQFVHEKLKYYGRFLILNALKKQNDIFKNGMSVKEWKDRLSVAEKYSNLFDAMLAVLINAGFISINDGIINIDETVYYDDTIKKEKELRAELDRIKNEVNGSEALCRLLEVCINSFFDVMSGKIGYADVMFKDGRMELVEDIYKGNCIVDYSNVITSDVVSELLSQKLKKYPERKIRILEIGAGTGSTTSFVLPKINRYSKNIEFVYTDISLGFTSYGRGKFGKTYPFIEYRALDISGDIKAQKFENDSFDIIYATNVLHATADIIKTLSNINSLIKNDGVLVINELTKVQEYGTLTFGLTDGWWLYKDEYRIKHSPLLNCQSWSDALNACGMHMSGKYELPENLKGELNHCIIVAEKRKNESYFSRLIYTLQTGREAMNYRLAFVVNSKQHLISCISDYFNKKNENCYCGKVANNQLTLKTMLEDEMLDLLNNKKDAIIAEKWAEGYEIPWDKMYNSNLPQKISLPTYHFDHKRYWIGQFDRNITVNNNTRNKVIYEVEADSPFITDHVVDGKDILPGAYIINIAFDSARKMLGKEIKEIKNVYFNVPLVSETNRSIIIESFRSDESEKTILIKEKNSDVQNASFDVSVEYPENNSIDIQHYIERCNEFMFGKRCYDRFNETGFAYGEMYRSMKNLYFGNDISISEIEVSDMNYTKGQKLLIHPSLLDAAFQAVLGFNINEKRVYVPYSVASIRMIKKPDKHCYAIAFPKNYASESDKKYDLIIVNRDGDVCIDIKGFLMKSFLKNNSESNNKLFICRQIWEEKEL